MESLYESPRLLDEYLLFHYGTPGEVLPWGFGPAEALGFPVRTVTAFTDGSPAGRALDLGCAVGRSSFVLSEFCEDVTGIDFSRQFVAAAETVRTEGRLEYNCQEEGRQSKSLTAVRPSGARPERIRFLQGDALALPEDLGSFDLVHAANLLCRLADPERLLRRFAHLVRPGGLLILTTPCTWLEEFTPPARWPDGGTFDWMRRILEPDFTLTVSMDLPFLIREHARKFQWSVAMGTSWRREKNPEE